MTREEAAVAWGNIERELEVIYLARRPKMKSWEVHHAFAVARRAVREAYETASGYQALREAAFNAVGWPSN